MGTSNWQNIPFCIEAILRIGPKRVFDVGVGFGRWGAVIREFGELWYGRIHKDQWEVHLEGVEGYAPNIEDHHHALYNKIHIGDFREVVASLEGTWDLVIFGDVLEHFEKEEGHRLLNWALSHSKYVLINIPLGEEWPQVDAYGNQYERHLSSWSEEEFAALPLRRRALFRDYIGRTFGTFILSVDDPKDIATQLYSASTATALETIASDVEDENRNLRAKVQRLEQELKGVKQSRSYRVTQRLLQSPYGPFVLRAAKTILPEEGGLLRTIRQRRLRDLPGAVRKHLENRRLRQKTHSPAHSVQLINTGQRAEDSHGTEVWLLQASTQYATLLDLTQVSAPSGWAVKMGLHNSSSPCLVSVGAAELRLALTAPAELTFLSHPWSGILRIIWRGHELTLDLHSNTACKVVVSLEDDGPPHIRKSAIHVPGSLEVVSSSTDEHYLSTLVAPPRPTIHSGLTQRAFSSVEVAWIEKTRSADLSAIAVMHPDWRGVRRSTEELFPEHFLQDDTLDAQSGERLARLLLETESRHIVLGGFPPGYEHLVVALHRLAPQVRVYSYWLGSFLQNADASVWSTFRKVEQLCRSGKIYKWGFAKKGMAEIVQSLGLRTGFLMSLVRQLPEGPSTPLAGGPHVGIWAIEPIWRKLPHAMLAACRMLDNVTVHGSGQNELAAEFAAFLNLSTKISAHPIPQLQMPTKLAQMHLNLYVTLSECAPMLPLESLAVGAPCLLGPNSHLFEDDPYLHSRLVVPYPDRALVIAEYAQRALDERTAIVTAYQRYAPNYNARALQSVQSFLHDDA